MRAVVVHPGWRAFAVAAAVAALAVGCSRSPEVAVESAPPALDLPSEVATTVEAVVPMPVITSAFASVEPDEWENYISIEYPVVSGLPDDIGVKINATLEEQFGVKDLAFPEDVAEIEGVSWQEDMGYTVGLHTPVLLSIQQGGYLYGGGAHGLPSSQDLTFDLATGELVAAFELLVGSSAAELSPLVRAELDRTVDLGHEATDTVLVDNQTWDAGFDRRGHLVITFQAYGIGPYAIGTPTVAFAPSELRERGLIAADGLYDRALAAIPADPDVDPNVELGGHDPVAVLSAVERYVATPDACDGQGAAEALDVAAALRVLDFPAMTVVFVPCATPGPGEQTFFEVRGWDSVNLMPIFVEQWVAGELLDEAMLLGAPYADGDILTNVEIWDELGECGLATDWIVEPDLLRMAQVRIRYCDDGAAPTSPDEWRPAWPPAD